MNSTLPRRADEAFRPGGMEFNLLPEEYARVRRLHPVSLSVVALVLLIVAGIGCAEYALHVGSSQGQLAALEERRQIQAVELGELAGTREALMKSIRPLVDHLKPHPPFSNVMVSLASAFRDERAWLDEADLDAQTGRCRLTGEAGGPASVKTVVARLREDPLFDSVSLAGMAKLPEGRGEGVEYEILAELRRIPR